MKVIQRKIINNDKFDYCVYFVQVNPENMTSALKELLIDLWERSWLNRINEQTIRNAFERRADKTCEYLENKFRDINDNDEIKRSAGEYIVSNLGRKVLIELFNHKDIPLMELLGKKLTNNSGFDFYSEYDVYLVAGEAKYKNNGNPYDDALKQILEFIKEGKHKDDILEIRDLIKEESRINMDNDIFDVCAAFSINQINDDKLISNILNNEHFKKCISSRNVFLVAVQMYGE